ncbi:GNAT family N-acetyltransferase [Cellulophaga baltica]|uniref:GNAT family N-acetyltransferase n=1 Tax=Cellulophaga TaxID=104264 RepID=UPI001C066A33|nr:MULTISPECIES: GNAT family N-acetyltransferase [Cellulophaga]MBU2996544.1 GNAT family N-acetyltransferase [Cellulophaga baltica]MDO6767938.1 GNAT family N-acetyltransferase [Cellulophaga sp. 1_MG-2023]
MAILIREAEKKDIQKILEIINYEILNATVVYDYDTRTYETQLKWFDKKKQDGFPVFVATNNENVIGYGTYGTFRAFQGFKYSIEHSIYVHKDGRGKGIGKLLLAHLIKTAKKQNYHVMIAGVDASNKASVQFHEKFGFTTVGVFKEVGFKFDKWLDLHFLQLTLKEV